MVRLFVFGLTFLSLSAVAETSQPLLSRTISGGMTAPGVPPMSQTCLVYADHVEFQASEQSAVVRLPVKFTKAVPGADEMRQMIGLAGQGRAEFSEGPTDGPVTTTTAYTFYPNEFIVLGQSGRQVITLKGEGVAELTELVNANCNPAKEVLELLGSKAFADRMAEQRAKLAVGERLEVTSVSVLRLRAAVFAYAHLSLITPCCTKTHGSIVGTFKYQGVQTVFESAYYMPDPQPPRR